MSDKVNLRNMLITDSTYLTLLGSPTTLPYKTFYLRPPQVPSFPFVVYTFIDAVTHKEISREIISKRIDVRFNIWTQDDSYDDIADRIVFLLHQVGNTNGFRVIYDGNSTDLYDPETNAYGVSLTFNLFLRKGII